MPKKYKGPRPINQQINKLARIFNLDPSYALEYAKHLPNLPEGAEGWFAIPSPVGLIFVEDIDDTYGFSYYRQCLYVCSHISTSRVFCNLRAGRINPKSIKPQFDTLRELKKMPKRQKGDFWIIAAQLGARHRGRSISEFQRIYSAENEYGLPSFAVGSILLTHPELLVCDSDLTIDCAGDDFSPDGDGKYQAAPAFDFCDGKVRFFVCSRDARGKNSGPASFFV